MSVSKLFHEQQSITASVTDLVRLLSSQLYSDPEVFLRELICNSYDALLRRNYCGKLPIEGLIRIRGDDDGIVEVEDNGIGMRKSDLVEFLSCIGKSATKKAGLEDQRSIGRFGLGFLSVIAVAKRIIVETRYAQETEDSHAYIWIWEGGTGYQIHIGKRKNPGTLIRVELKTEYSGYATPSFLERLVQKHVPFLDVTINVHSKGDPRQARMPWQDNHSQNNKWRDRIKIEALKEWIEKPVHYFATSFCGGNGVFAFPHDVNIHDDGLGVCLRGVLVNNNMKGLLSDAWNWVKGVIDLIEGTLILNRSDFRKDKKFEKIRKEIETSLQDELIFLCHKKNRVFQHLIKVHRDKISNILSNNENLLNKIGRNYSFVTTLGELSFTEILGVADRKKDKLILEYIDVSPNTDARWATYRATGRLLILCSNKSEEAIFKKLAQFDGSIQWNYLTQIPSIRGPVGRIAPVLSKEMQTWFNDLREYLRNEGIHIEPSKFPSDNIISVLQLSKSKPASRHDGLQSESDNILVRFFKPLTPKPGPKENHGMLLLNVLNPAVQAMVKQADSTCPLELATALLLTNGAVQSGMPIESEWQDVLAKFTESGIKTLIKGPHSEKAVPHVLCFFAHQFSTDKPLLAALRRVLEHEPYFWEVVSGEEETEEPELFDNILKQLIKSHIFIGEVTRNNPNVLFETGLAFGMKDKGKTLLLLEKSSSIASDLRGHLYYEYDPNDLEKPNLEFVRKFHQWISKQTALRRYKRHQPFLGYRLLVEAGILNVHERSLLENEIGEPFAFLAETPVRVSKQTSISQTKLKRAQEYLKRRIDRYRQQHDN